MRRRPALAASILTLGASVAGMLGIVALLARDDPVVPDVPGPRRLVEVRIGNDVTDDQARDAVRAWLDEQADIGSGGDLRVIDAPSDTRSSPS